MAVSSGRKKYFFLVIIGLALGLYFAFGQPTRQPAISAPRPAKAARLTLAPVLLLEVRSPQDFSATVQASLTAQIAARISAHVKEIGVQAGSRAQKGDLLAKLDDGDIRAQLKQAEAAVVSAEATNREAVTDLGRFSRLVKTGSVSRQQYDQAETRAQTAWAGLAATRQQMIEARERLSYAEIRAPFDGIVVDKMVEPGDLAVPGRTLILFQDPTRLRLEAPTPETCADRIKVGEQIRVDIFSAELSLEARITEIVPALDPQTHSFLVRLDLPAKPNLRPGMFGRIQLPCSTRKILAVPAKAVFSRGQLDYVFVASGGAAHLRLVRLGAVQGDKVEILSGVAEVEKVVIEAPAFLQDGDSIEVGP